MKLSSQCGCSVTDLAYQQLGGDIAFTLMLSGHWSAIAKIETQLEQYGKKHHLSLNLKRTKLPKHRTPLIPCNVTVVGLDAPDPLYNITRFFTANGIAVHSIRSHTYLTQYTATQMFNVEMVVHIPAELQLAEVTEDFMILCEELNYDAMLEPEKPS
ncbi:MAG: hypothetical protein DHS20C10_12460 [marine bacterium B5-7]|nr:MAG: hypothetical protein DHS20C10_12460 [marine bacterium B5-7]